MESRQYRNLAEKIVKSVEKTTNTYDAIEVTEKELENDVRYGWARLKGIHDQEVYMWRRGALFGATLAVFVGAIVAFTLFGY